MKGRAAAFSSDGALAASTNNNELALWNAKTGERIWLFEGEHSDSAASIPALVAPVSAARRDAHRIREV